MQEYKYEPLDLERPAIRLLRLHRGLISDISCELFQAELHQRRDSISYEALSYTWGSPDLAQSILVNGNRMKITDNLHETLLHLRTEDEDRILWVDAVCIDQANLKERGHQVAQMGQIYKEADRVIFHLGPGSHETDVFMRTLSFLQQASVKLACKDWSAEDKRWKEIWASFKVCHANQKALQQDGLQEILRRPWFRRVWILQEAAFAKAGIISCGMKSVSARLFCLAPRLVGVTPDKHCQSVLDIMPSPWRKASWRSQSRSLYELLRAFGSSEATDKRDLVYALRAMSSDSRDTSQLVPNYEKSEADVVRDVFRALYLCELECLELSLRPRSLPELITGLQSMNGDENLLGLLKGSPLCDNMEEVFRTRRYIPVNQRTLAIATQHDETGRVVESLLRHRGGELKIDDNILLCAAANAKGVGEVLSVLVRHQEPNGVTKPVLVAAAENQSHRDAAIDHLSPLKIEVCDIAAIAEALASTPSRYVRARIIRSLLLQKDGAARASALLTTFAQYSDSGNLVQDFLDAHPDYRIAPEPAIIAVIQNSRRGRKSLENFLWYCPSKITITRGIIQAAAPSTDAWDLMKLLLDHPAVQKPLSVEEQFAVLAPFTNRPLMECFLRHHGGGVVSAEAVRATSVYERSTLAALTRGQTFRVRMDDDALECLVKKFGLKVVVDLVRFRLGLVMKERVLFRQLLASLDEEEDSRRTGKMQAASAGGTASEQEQHTPSSALREREAGRLRRGRDVILVWSLRQTLRDPKADEEWQAWLPLARLVADERLPQARLQNDVLRRSISAVWKSIV